MSFKKINIFLIVINSLFMQTSKVEEIYCPAMLLCQGQNCSSQDKTNFQNWKAYVDNNFGPTLYGFTDANASTNGVLPMCNYREVGQPYGPFVTIISYNSYYAVGPNWKDNLQPQQNLNCPTTDFGFTNPKNCAFSITPTKMKRNL